ncbi:MAG: hypothetical protein WCA19_07740 [Candidatus Acidiferrales bacterium]
MLSDAGDHAPAADLFEDQPPLLQLDKYLDNESFRGHKKPKRISNVAALDSGQNAILRVSWG